MTTENSQCPDPFICPIMQDGEPMQDPVMAADGHTYEHSGIAEWLANHTTSPVTSAVLSNQGLTPNHQLKSQIEQWRKGSLRGSRSSRPSWPRFTCVNRVRMPCPRCLC